MTSKGDAPYERFATSSDALIADGRGLPASAEDLIPELSTARRLRSAAGSGIPDPAFVDGLAQELRLRARAHVAAAATTAHEAVTGLRYATMDTPVGRLALAYRDGRVVYCSAVGWPAGDGSVGGSKPGVALGEPAGQETAHLAAFQRAVARELGAWPERETAPPAAIELAVREHLAGRRRFRALDLSWLTPFQQRVLEKTAEIPHGEVRPYRWVAREIGAPGAVRAVGTALGHNPVPFLIPCHRVVRSDGHLGEYSGGGPAAKVRVLTLEGAPVTELVGGPRYRGSSTTRIVCYPSCHAARRIRPENVVSFVSLARARDRGYRPCILCRPA